MDRQACSAGSSAWSLPRVCPCCQRRVARGWRGLEILFRRRKVRFCIPQELSGNLGHLHRTNSLGFHWLLGCSWWSPLAGTWFLHPQPGGLSLCLDQLPRWPYREWQSSGEFSPIQKDSCPAQKDRSVYRRHGHRSGFCSHCAKTSFSPSPLLGSGHGE